MVGISTKIKRLLMDEGLVESEAWEAAAARGADVIETLIDNGKLDEEGLMEVLGRSAGVPPVDLVEISPDTNALDVLDEAACKDYCVLPLTKNGNILTLAVSDPFDVLLFDDLTRRTKCQLRMVFAHRGMLKAAIERTFDSGAAQVAEMLEQVSDSGELISAEEDAETEDIEMVQDGDEAPAVKLANLIILRALKAKASDIHVEPGDKQVQVRFRIDGRMQKIMNPPKGLLNALNSRLKILAQLDIAERNKPQDGKFQIRFEGRSIDCRLSMLPVVGGEKAVIRILDAGSFSMSLEGMGWEPKCFDDVQKAIAQPYGMMLVTGPTGSGKSTTLYSCVQTVATEEVNVTTVEDPVEYRMDGINQVQVNPKRGLTFAGALRSILRQDPDIVLVGEIRDKETADIAIKAALTGHLVFSTLHTNNAIATITRLVDMGIDPFMVSSSLLLVVAQRLGRRLCSHCKQEVEEPPYEHLIKLGLEESAIENMELFSPNPSGCARCTQGYRGRFPVLETLPISHGIRRLVVAGKSVDEIKELALDEGMLTLRRIGMLNASRGVTSVEEILRITLED